MRLAGRLLAIVAVLGAAGCRTAEVNSIAHNRPPEVRTQPSFDLDEFVAERNENAARIQSLKTTPAITATMQGKTLGQAKGWLALERPRNFKLEIGSYTRDFANLGSNEQEFWYWFSEDPDKSVYFCNYEDRSSTSLAVTYQPDWIIDAIGLSPITQQEASRIQVKTGPTAGTSLLVFPPKRGSGLPYTRTMVVTNQTRQVQQLKILGEDGKTLLAQATIQQYFQPPVGSPRRGASGTPAQTVTTCTLPKKMTLEWKREQMILDVLISGAEINKMPADQSTALFVEPTPRGARRVDLAQLAPGDGSQSAGDMRESMPIPEPRKRATRSTPGTEIRGDEATSRASGTRRVAAETTKAASNGVVLMPILDLDVVDAPRPGPANESFASGTALVPPPSTARE